MASDIKKKKGKEIKSFTMLEPKANIMFFVNVSQNKRAGVSNQTVWTNEYFTSKTADNTDVSSVAVCCSK